MRCASMRDRPSRMCSALPQCAIAPVPHLAAPLPAPTATALLVLGSICFIPGAYHTRVAYLAWRGVEGYSLNEIPDL